MNQTDDLRPGDRTVDSGTPAPRAGEQGPRVPPPALALPEAEQQPVLGDYRIVREVGRGGMGVVYEAEQLSLRRRVALKVLPLAAAFDPRQQQRFRTEAEAAAHLHHTHIVPVYAVGCERGVHYYAMQFIDGRNLAAVIKDHQRLGEGKTEDLANRGPSATRSLAVTQDVSPSAPETALASERSIHAAALIRTAVTWCVQAAEALEHAHQLGIVHRDVKPANLLLDERGHLWVTDFGLAQVRGDTKLTRSGDLLGTLRYMSPEQAQARRGIVDHRTDIYSLGATLYELLTLRPVFPGRDRQELLSQIALDDPRLPCRLNRAIPVDLETVVLKALAKDPGERYATAQELADDLRRFLEDRPVLARRPSLRERALRWSRRHRAVVGASLAVLLMAVVALAASAIYIWREKEQTQREADLADAGRTRAVHETVRAERAKKRADRETRRARQAFREEIAQRRLAEDNLRLAFQALDGYVAEAEGYLARDARSLLNERQAITRLLKFYEQFLARNPGHATVPRKVVSVYARIGRLQRNLGHFEEAHQALQQAITFCARLAAQSPRDAGLRRQQASLHEDLGLVLRALGRTADAEQALRHAAALIEKQPADSPRLARSDRFANRQLQGRALSWLGVLLRDESRFAEAETVLAQSQALWQDLVAKRGQPSDRYGLGHCRNNQGLLYAYTGKLRKAEQAHLQAEDLFARLAADHPRDSLRYLNDLAATRFNLGNLWLQRQPPRAEKYYRSALAIREHLVKRFPGVFDFRIKLGRVYGNLGIALEGQGKLAEARSCQEQAIQVKLAALRTNQQHPNNRKGLCYAYLNLGRFLQQLNRLEEANTAYGQALEVAVKLARDFPGEQQFRRALPDICHARADFLLAVGHFREAEQEYLKALPLWKQLAEDFPALREYQELQGTAWLSVSDLREETDRPREADEASRQAQAIFEKLVIQHPDVAGCQSGLAIALHRVADGLNRQQQWKESCAHLRRAIRHQQKAVKRQPRQPRYVAFLGQHYRALAATLLRRGDHAGAARTVAEYVRECPTAWVDAYQARKLFADCVAMAEKDARLTPQERQSLTRSYAEKARAMLTEAVQRCGDDPTLWNQLAWNLVMDPDPKQRDPAQAVVLARKVVERTPDEALARQTLGVACYRAGNWKEALAGLEQAVQRTRKGGTAWFFLAMAQWQTGKKAEARQTYDRAVQLLAQGKSMSESLRAVQAEAAALLKVNDRPTGKEKK